MKEIFIQFRQWIIKHRKKIIYGALALLIFQIGFFDLGGIGIENNNVFAADEQPQEDFNTKLTRWEESLSFFKVVLYILIYPILIVAGKLVDNSMVYGEIFGFDAILRNLWVIIRNIANFGLGALFMYYIFKFLINGQKTEEIKKLLISALIAGIGIQASWFIMSALIDASTIITYGIGGLPLTIAKGSGDILRDPSGQSKQLDPYILKTTVLYDVQTDPKDIQMYMSTGSQMYIAECQTFNVKSGTVSETFLLAPKYIYYQGGMSGGNIIKTMCNYDNNVYFFSDLYEDISTARNENNTGTGEAQSKYKEKLETTINHLQSGSGGRDGLKGLIEQGKILQIGDAHASSGINGTLFQGIAYNTGQKFGVDKNNEWNGSGGNAKQMHELIDGTYAGVFTNLYTSLLNMGEGFKITETGGDTPVTTLNACLSLLFLLVISVPLIAMTIIFIMRVFIIWVAIAISPIIVLLKAFDLYKSASGSGGMGKYLEYFEVTNLIKIIFFPAIMCFAISLASVLVEIIKNINADDIATGPLTILGGAITLNVGGFTVGLGKIICSIICLAATWFLLWTGIEFTKIGKEGGIVQSLKGLTTSALGSLPIIPIPTADGRIENVGVDAVFGGKDNNGIFSSITSKLKSEFEGDNSKAVENFFHKTPNDPAADITTYVQNLTPIQGRENKDIDIGSGKKLKFSGMTKAQQQQVIEKINELDDSKKAQFEAVSRQITMADKTTYSYDAKSKKYIEDTQPQGGGNPQIPPSSGQPSSGQPSSGQPSSGQ